MLKRLAHAAREHVADVYLGRKLAVLGKVQFRCGQPRIIAPTVWLGGDVQADGIGTRPDNATTIEEADGITRINRAAPKFDGRNRQRATLFRGQRVVALDYVVALRTQRRHVAVVLPCATRDQTRNIRLTEIAVAQIERVVKLHRVTHLLLHIRIDRVGRRLHEHVVANLALRTSRLRQHRQGERLRGLSANADRRNRQRAFAARLQPNGPQGFRRGLAIDNADLLARLRADAGELRIEHREIRLRAQSRVGFNVQCDRLAHARGVAIQPRTHAGLRGRDHRQQKQHADRAHP